MDNIVEHLSDLARRCVEIKDMVHAVILNDGSVAVGLATREQIKNLITHVNIVTDSYNQNNTDGVINHAGHVSWCGNQIASEFENSQSKSVQEAAQLLRTKCADLKITADNGPGTLQAMDDLAHLFADPMTASSDYERGIAKGENVTGSQPPTPPLLSETANGIEEIDASILKLSERLADHRKELSDLELMSRVKTQAALAILEQGVIDLKVLKEQTEAIAGHTSKNVIAGSYDASAEQEAKWANNLRWGSLGCMAVAGAVLIYTLLEAARGEFAWQQAAVRVVIAFLLSVPAAYLARESAKHREQQYHHLQTSLDLKAVSPFVASLPAEQQHKIKAAIADRLFAGRDFSKVGIDSFPINLQEVLIEALRVIDRKRASNEEVNTKAAVQASEKLKPKPKFKSKKKAIETSESVNA